MGKKESSEKDFDNRRQFIDRRQKQLPILPQDERRKGDRRRKEDREESEQSDDDKSRSGS